MMMDDDVTMYVCYVYMYCMYVYTSLRILKSTCVYTNFFFYMWQVHIQVEVHLR